MLLIFGYRVQDRGMADSAAATECFSAECARPPLDFPLSGSGYLFDEFVRAEVRTVLNTR